MIRRLGTITAALALALAPAASASAATLVNLGPNFMPVALNNHAQIVGAHTNLNTGEDNFDLSEHAAIWQDGIDSPLAQPAGAMWSEADDINDSGKVVGLDTSTGATPQHGVVWSAATPGVEGVELGPFFQPRIDLDLTSANAVDDAGDVIGRTLNEEAAFLIGYLWDGTDAHKVGLADVSSTNAVAISADGSKVLVDTDFGSSYAIVDRAELDDSGTTLDDKPEPSAPRRWSGALQSSSLQADLGPDGSYLGWSGTQASPVHHLLLPGGTTQTIEGLRLVAAVNRNHVVAGSMIAENGLALHAAIWRNGTVVDLNSLLPAGSGFVLIDAFDINDRGDVIGLAEHEGKEVGFYLPGASARISATKVKCLPGNGGGYACTATVTDATADGTTQTPTGSVGFSSPLGLSQFAAPLCALEPVAAGVSSCEDDLTVPASATHPFKVTASYDGDSAFVGSNGVQTVCGQVPYLLESIVPTREAPYGDHVLRKVTVNGCGLAAGQTLTFGVDIAFAKARLTAADVSPDGTRAEVEVPIGATSGDATLSDGVSAPSTIHDVEIDSFRNTMGFGFQNFAAHKTSSDLLHAFVTDLSHGQYLDSGHKVRKLADYWQQWLDAEEGGQTFDCFGMSYAVSRFADRSLDWKTFDASAVVPHDLALGAGRLVEEIRIDQLKQYAEEAYPFYRESRAQRSGKGVEANLTRYLGKDGFATPVLVSLRFQIHGADGSTKWEGHAMVAYGIESVSDPSSFRIDLYDPNTQFVPDEDVNGGHHEDGLRGSHIVVHGDGQWEDPELGVTGGPQDIEFVPIAALEGPLHISEKRALRFRVPAKAHVVSVTGAGIGPGLNLATGETPAGVTVVPVQQDVSGDEAPTPGPGVSGIGEIDAPLAAETVVVGSGSRLLATFQSPTLSAELDGAKGYQTLSFDPAKGKLSVGAPPAGQHPSKAASLQLVSEAAGKVEREVTLSGALTGVTAAIHGTKVTVTAAKATKLGLVFSVQSPSGPQTFDAGKVALGKGATLTATPASWAKLTSVAARVGHRRLKLRNHFRVPAAKATHLARAKVGLTLVASLPKVAAGTEWAVTYALVARRKGKTVARASGVLGGKKTTIMLKNALPKGTAATVTLETGIAGRKPSRAKTVKRFRL